MLYDLQICTPKKEIHELGNKTDYEQKENPTHELTIATHDKLFVK